MTAHSTRLVLVPGLACTEDLFADQIASLRGDLAISVADHTQHDTVSGIARAVLAAASDRFALCGLSMGGYIAFEVMRQAPDRVERLALLDASALPDTPDQSERRLTLIAMAQSGEFKSVRDTLWPLLVHPARISPDDRGRNRRIEARDCTRLRPSVDNRTAGCGNGGTARLDRSVVFIGSAFHLVQFGRADWRRRSLTRAAWSRGSGFGVLKGTRALPQSAPKRT
jgi:pimeloyl-ACP methyl ester carboxylesterase